MNSHLTRGCHNNQKALEPGICANCPSSYRTTQQAQNALDLDAASRYPSEKSNNNLGKKYCGNVNVIKKWILYSNCHGTRQPNLINPFQWSGIGTPNECFQSGKTVGSIIGSKNFNPSIPPPQQPPAIVPVVPVRVNRGRGRNVQQNVSESSSLSSEEEEKELVPVVARRRRTGLRQR